MLPRWELSLYLLVSLGFHFYSFYEVYKASREHEEELDREFELETNALFGRLKKDPTDFEWSFWMEWGKQRLLWLFLGHMAVSQLAMLLVRKHRPWLLTAYGMWACWHVLGAPGVAMVLLHTIIAFCVAQFRSLLLSWLCSLLLLSTLRLQGVEEVKMQQPELCSVKDSLFMLARGLGRLLCWWGLAELMVHLMYMHAIYSSIPLLGAVSCWTLGGLALAQVLFFYVKYLVLFGIPALLMRLDGLKPPPLPRCVSTMFSFTGMWRHFDVGLHNFLIRYVYIPLGGSKHGRLGTLISTAMTFSFVSYWHGSYDYLWCWAALNWLGVTVENGIRRLVESPCMQECLARYLSPPARRRLHAALASCSTSMLILFNLVFLGGNQVGKTYWERIFIQGWPWVTLSVLAFLYCYSHVGIAWAQT
ncbi:protein-cysteine N-palmitoyltransferase HHAT isoform X2 [Perognathus longimembris pacificus]|uniref:protein-cysteine N-palmitoyltransferase HHAT isoform X2 n=1 Tax=Perognathus longimembris pacificus TaxID=214514 RepID=UPI00201A1C79|nr:protein-cysteine N-palmitoyltransferase HHAT isoform X2 [Perognathus longimembris pacificus]